MIPVFSPGGTVTIGDRRDGAAPGHVSRPRAAMTVDPTSGRLEGTCWLCSSGGTALVFETSGTFAFGDRRDGAVPGHVDSTAGHALVVDP